MLLVAKSRFSEWCCGMLAFAVLIAKTNKYLAKNYPLGGIFIIYIVSKFILMWHC